MDPRQAIAALRAGWWLLLVGLLVGGAVALGVSLLQTPVYASSTQFFITTTTDPSAAQALQGSQFSVQRAVAYAQLIPGEDLATRVIHRLHLDMSTEELQSQIEASEVVDTGLIDVTVTDPSASQAKSIADAIDTEFGPFITELETPAGGGASPVKVTVTDRPEIAVVPTSPDIRRNVATGAVLGLLAGAALTVARGRPDSTIEDAEQAAELADAPVIGHIVRDDALAKEHLIDRTGAGLATENYRQLRNHLQWLDVDNPPTVIMVTSAVPAEGKTMTVLNLGLVLADAGRKVTIVDADLRTPKVTKYLGMPGGAGLSNILGGSAELVEVVQRYNDRDMWVIAAGPTPSNPGELLSSGQMQSLIKRLRGDNDYVLFDAPPMLPVADASGLAAHMDGVLLAVRQGRTRAGQVREAAERLRQVRARTLGVILTMVTPKAEMLEGAAYRYTQAAPGTTGPVGREAGNHSSGSPRSPWRRRQPDRDDSPSS
jgi:capsular exopolysaccharide synthesis family protein